MDISVALIRELREKSGAGMADCKAALTETGGDIPKAIEYLRKKGAAMATKRADKIAKEGAVKSAISGDRKTGAIVEVNCETDFVAKGEGFQNFAQKIADTALANGIENPEELLSARCSDGLTVQETIDSMMASVGERIELKRAKILRSENGFISTYIHFGSKVGAIIALSGKYSPEADDLGKKVAMQTVAMTPITVRREEVSDETIAKEKEIYVTQARNEKKPENIIDKIVANKLEKFFQENCLVEQSFIQDEKKSIGDILKDHSGKSGEPLDVLAMARFQLG